MEKCARNNIRITHYEQKCAERHHGLSRSLLHDLSFFYKQKLFYIPTIKFDQIDKRHNKSLVFKLNTCEPQ